MGASIVAMAIRVAAAALVEERRVRRKLWYAEYAMTPSTSARFYRQCTVRLVSGPVLRVSCTFVINTLATELLQLPRPHKKGGGRG